MTKISIPSGRETLLWPMLFKIRIYFGHYEELEVGPLESLRELLCGFSPTSLLSWLRLACKHPILEATILGALKYSSLSYSH